MKQFLAADSNERIKKSFHFVWGDWGKLNKDEKIRLRGALLDIGPLPRIEIICENILPLTGPFDGKIKKNIICSGFLI